MSTRALLTAALLIGAALIALYLVPHEFHDPHSTAQGVEFLLFGLVVGAYGTMVGAGGGFLIVPALLLAYHATPEQAAGTSITVVFLNAASGTYSYARQKKIDYRAGFWFALATVPGAIAGAFMTSFLGGRLFNVVFAVLLLALSLFLLWRPVAEEEIAESLIAEAEASRWLVQRTHTDVHETTYGYTYDLRIGIVLSLFVGFLSSILGIGGGIIHVPALIHLLGFPAHLATATSHFILVITAVIGTGTHLALGHVLFGPAILMGIGVIAGAQVGASMGRRLKGSLLIRLLSLALIVVAARLIFH